MENTLGNHYRAIMNAHDLTLDDGGNGQFDYLVQIDGSLVEHLGDDGHRAVCSLTDTEGEVTC